ncbi:MAG: AAA domain-containing protein [Sedimentisphaerales bacterium]
MTTHANPDSNNPTQVQGNLAFVKELAKYFMDFLETDFHKRSNPKRSLKLRNESNLLVAVNLNKYPTFNKVIWKSINQTFKRSTLIAKGSFVTNIPMNLLGLIKAQVHQLSDTTVTEIIRKISEQIENISSQYKKEYDKALTIIVESTEQIIKEGLVLPFVNNLEKSLERLTLGDEDSIFLMEEELTEVIVNLLQNKISEILNRLIAEESVSTPEELASVFGLDDIKNNIMEFFEDFKITDLLSEVSEMQRNKSILENQEFYLYFFDISFNKTKYPIFYIPFSIAKCDDSLSLNFDSQVYINKKALEFIAQEYNNETGRKGSVKLPTGRIIYVAQYSDSEFPKLISDIIQELADFFKLDPSIDISDPSQQVAKSLLVRISNSCYISLFDKSDESLINDYEQILELLSKEDNPLGGSFNKIVDEFIHKNPTTFNTELEDEWDDSDVSDKLVSPNPIPLNGEQRQILSAIRKHDCNYIAVEGPPGTGKSHTITAIAFNAILANKSVLVLSDKKEALDVVEEKITEVMNTVRYDKNFQNPILRLGRTGNTYSQILSKSSIDNIRAQYRAVRKEYEAIENNIDKSANTLKEDLDAEILAYQNIDLREINELCQLERRLEGKDTVVDIAELTKQRDSFLELEEIRKTFLKIVASLRPGVDGMTELLGWFQIHPDSFKTIESFSCFVNAVETVAEIAGELKDTFSEKIELFRNLPKISDKDAEILEGFVKRYEELKSGIWGFLFKRRQVQRLNQEFNRAFPHLHLSSPHKSLYYLNDIIAMLSCAKKERTKLPPTLISRIDYLALIHRFIASENARNHYQKIKELQSDIEYLQSALRKYPLTSVKIKFDPSNFQTFRDNALTQIKDDNFSRILRYLSLSQKITRNFVNIPSINYSAQSRNIENLTTLQMTYLMDGRLISFYDHNLNFAISIRNVITHKMKFDRKEFSKLKDAFPCILAGIRDYAEYIPLEPAIFDLVIIDEASQVSIAQAFPALLRAKKVVIFGDKKQFSNIKAAHAHCDTNKEYLSRLKEVFSKHISNEPTKLEKLEKFNIRTSILEFFEFVCNYSSRLLKHFRGYKELISYSNEYFYFYGKMGSPGLHVMKIRGKPVDEVLKFSVIPHDGKSELLPNSNTLEAEFIITELRKLKENNKIPSVGIITPHTNQQKKLVEMISKLPEKDYFFDELKLKIMTFDTCQGEERDIIFYSMVATRENDRLWGVFIKNLSHVDLEEDGQIKAQRLNVGFSRSKECMHFVLSKPLEEYEGSIGEALRHYKQVLEEAKKERSASEVDKKSKMEPAVLNWFYQTRFWNEHKHRVEFIPQFEIGKYLRQLDRTYTHPEYVVDFLLVVDSPGDAHQHKIILEYDGFREHFEDTEVVNRFNYEAYYSEEDVYRQKVLEGYGYKFLRINKFNLGEDPVTTLDQRIQQILKDKPQENQLLNSVLDNVEEIQNGKAKECPKCGELRSVDDFADSSLITGYGRFCKHCKSSRKTTGPKTPALPFPEIAKKGCPKCGSTMVLRNGRYGLFFGCSKYPYCKGTRNL